ncbi:hypothetical protein LXL04_022526 [Taraxacum kok-saghyz]
MKDVDFSRDKDLAKDFLQNFADAEGEAKYISILQDVANRKVKAIEIDIGDLFDYKDLDEEFVGRVTENTRRYVGVFADAIDELIPKPTEAFQDDDLDILMTQRAEEGNDNADGTDPRQKMPPEIRRFYEVYIKASSKDQPFTIREVRDSHIGQLVKISGIVTRCTDVKPLMKVAVYTCEECGFEIYQEVTARVFMPLFECPSKRCNVNRAKGSLILQLRTSKFWKFQEIGSRYLLAEIYKFCLMQDAKLQELTEHVPKGHIPRTMTVHFRGELTRKVSPGDVVELSGIFLPIPYTGFRAMRAGLVVDTYLETMSISHFKKKYEDYELKGVEEEEIARLAEDGDIYNKLARSLAPEIFGHEDIKKALLLLLVGAPHRKLKDGMKVILHECFVKLDDGFAPRGVYTTGKGSCGVGLTAAVQKDHVTNEFVLEDLAKDFLQNFADAEGEAKYISILVDVANRKVKAIEIDLGDLFDYKDLDEEFVGRVTENTRRYVGVFADAIDELIPKPTEAFQDDDLDILMTQSPLILHSPLSIWCLLNNGISPTTPSPLQPKSSKKPALVIGQSPSTPASNAQNPIYGDELVNRRIKVYWPLDKAWYEGCVKSFDKSSGKHLVHYDDSEEEHLDLSKEKIELLKEQAKRFRRLRKFSIEEEYDDEAGGGSQGIVDKNVESGSDDSADEDWGKNVEKEAIDDEMEDLDLVDEEEEEEVEMEETKAIKQEPKKRKSSAAAMKPASVKKIKNETPLSPTVLEHKVNNNSGKTSAFVDNGLVGDKAERFATREEEKFKFLGKNRKDAKKRSHGNENYDPRTLYLPPSFLESLSGCQMGKFYELFEMDAHVGAKELDLQYMKVKRPVCIVFTILFCSSVYIFTELTTVSQGDQPHCGFPEKNFATNVEKLACKVVKREICGVVTKGTLLDGEMVAANPDASYLFAVSEASGNQDEHGDRIYGVCVVDVATSKIMIGQFEDDSKCSGLSCLLSQLRPVEIIKPMKSLTPETEKVLVRQTKSPVINELIPLEEFWDAEKTTCEIKNIYKRISSQSSLNESMSINDCLPQALSDLINTGNVGSHALSALGGTLFYLKKAFLDESLLRFEKFELLPCSGFSDSTTKPYMILDAAALENLEVFENNVNGSSKGTLYEQLNRCVTASGKRLLKT